MQSLRPYGGPLGGPTVSQNPKTTVTQARRPLGGAEDDVDPGGREVVANFRRLPYTLRF